MDIRRFLTAVRFQGVSSAAWSWLPAFGLALVIPAGGIAQVRTPDRGDATLVGRSAEGEFFTPVNQIVTPLGRQVELPGMRPQVVAFHPSGEFLITAGKTSELVVVDPLAAQVIQRVALPPEDQAVPDEAPVSTQILKPDQDAQVSYTGLVFSPSGDRIYMSNVEGSIKVFAVRGQREVVPLGSWRLPPANAPRRAAEIPSGLALNSDGTKLYVCGNLSNRLHEVDTKLGQVLRSWDVGVAPYDVVLAGSKAYVSNWGGRRPQAGDVTGPAGRGTTVKVDPVRFIANEGSVSVVALDAPAEGTSPAVPREIVTGLHASGLARSDQHPFIVCCNAGSDHLSVIDSRTDELVATVWAKPNAADLLGAAPNAAVFSPDGRRLYVANGSQNAIAIIKFDAEEMEETKLAGMVPVGWYPGAVALDPERHLLVAANIKGLPQAPEPAEDLPPGTPPAEGFNSHQYYGSLSILATAPEDDLPAMSERVALNLRAPRIAAALLPPRDHQPARAIPERIGEPSLIKHVVYIIKENRTYDQVFGALPRGNGHPQLCIFGANITPNQHKLADEFVLLDNTYCAGILSADGHQWSTTAYSTDYMEKSFAGFPRSYPDGMGVDENDALAYSPAGFIWDHALRAGLTIRNYGEFMGPDVRWRDANRQGKPAFLDCYRAWRDRTDDVVFSCWPSVESLEPFSPTAYVGWEMAVPDQYRADFILNELKQFEEKNEFPHLVIICLPNDHTSGTQAGSPTPAACMADNDLAFGRIVEGLSHSKFWPQMAIFAIEDDPQAGWDHVSGYRTIAFCVSPYAKRGAVVSTQYNTTSVLRTIGQILGMRPMNQFDASATPMFDCFTDQPRLKPFDAVPALVPLDQMNPEPQTISDPVLREDALVSATLNFREIDQAPEDVLNRILWRAMRGSQDPYPQWAITANAEEEEEEEEAALLRARGAQSSSRVPDEGDDDDEDEEDDEDNPKGTDQEAQ